MIQNTAMDVPANTTIHAVTVGAHEEQMTRQRQQQLESREREARSAVSRPGKRRSSSSSTSQHLPVLEPVSGKVLFEQECRRRDALWGPRGKGRLGTGCREVDEEVLAGGGFERGCVVGVSAEGIGEDEDGVIGGGYGKRVDGGGGGVGDEEDVLGVDVALVMALQVVARMLVGRRARGERLGRAMVISTMGASALAGVVRDVLRGEMVRVEGEESGGDRARLRELLVRIDISRVFDVPGLWEVLGELDRLPASQELGEWRMGWEGQQKEGEDEKEEEMGEVKQGGEAVRDDEVMLEEASRGQHDDEKDEPEISASRSPPATGEQEGMTAAPSQAEEPASSPLSDPPSSLPDEPPWETTMEETSHGQRTTPPGRREVIQDSEEEDEVLLSPVSSANVSVASPDLDLDEQHGVNQAQDKAEDPPDSIQLHVDIDEAQKIPTAQDAGVKTRAKTNIINETATTDNTGPPDIIIISHMSTLLSSLFHQREKAAAHEMLQLLASHLRYLTRAPEHNGPLIMILNSTTSTSSTTSETPLTTHRDHDAPPAPSRTERRATPLDPTLRSIFNPPPPRASGLSYDAPQSARRNKPSFGLVFTQMLDVHLLCTRLPRTRADAEALYGLTSPLGVRRAVGYAWVVEVLLDEAGIWEGGGRVLEGRPRRSREQRWGAVRVRRDRFGLRMVDAFEKRTDEEEGEVRIAVAGGFGGRRV